MQSLSIQSVHRLYGCPLVETIDVAPRKMGTEPTSPTHVAAYMALYCFLRGWALVGLLEMRVVGQNQLLLRYQFPVTIFDTVSELPLVIQMLVPSKATPDGTEPVG